MKKILAIVLSLILVIGLCACSQNSEKDITEIKIGVLKGPTGIGSAYLMEQNKNNKSKNRYSFTLAGSPDELTAQLISCELDMVSLPTNVIASLYNKTDGEIKILGVNALGVLYILEKGNSLNTLEDLNGKTILCSGKGSTAEYVLSHILSHNNIDAKIEWAAEHSEAATLALSGNYDIVMFPEPFVTTVTEKSSDFRIAFDLTREWEDLDLGSLPMGGIAVRKEFYEENEKELKLFSEEYSESVSYVNNEPVNAARLCEKFDIVAASIAEKAIPRCNIVWMDEGYEDQLMGFYNILFVSNPKSVGGAIPGSDFFA